MSEQPPPGDVVAEVSIFAEAEVVHGDPDRCTDECRERCAAAREESES